MPGLDKHSDRDFSKYDNLDTRTLEEILRKDSRLPESEKSDLGAITYIMELLQKRYSEASNGEFGDADAAWREFNQHYRPTADGKSLYDDEIVETSSAKRPRKASRGVAARVAGVAAVLAAVVLFGTVTASAFGFNLWGKVASWTADTFGYTAVRSNQQTDEDAVKPKVKTIPDELKELEILLSQYGIANTVLPGFIPEGYEAAECQRAELDETVDFRCNLSKGDDNILLKYTLYNTDKAENQYTKDEGDPEIYDKDGERFYILTNCGQYYAVWTSGMVECCILINGNSSRKRLIEIIDSI